MEEQKTNPDVVKSGETSYSPEDTPRRHRSRLWLLIGGGVFALLIIAAIVMEGLTIKKLSNRLDDLEWEQRIANINSEVDKISPESNVIQFLKRGYTIELEQVTYTQEGLRLSGYLGNPTNLWLHTVSLKFKARKHESFEEFKKQDPGFRKWFLYLENDIGSAQTETIPVILPGQKGHFQVTIPNVRQTKEGFELRVSFSGERYSYR